MSIDEFQISRQKAIVGAGVGLAAVALTACSSYGKTDEPAAAPATPAETESGAPGGALAATADVPVGSGLIVGDVVLTQPTAGVFKGFSSACTHKGCAVTKVADGTIDCACHGSKFNLDGTVAQGPATTPLEAKPVSVQGDSIVLG